jgi:cytochrome c oxidase subunit 2
VRDGVIASAADTRGEYHSVVGLYLPLAVLVFVVVVAAMAIVVVRGRARPGRPARPMRSRPRLELLLAAVIAALAAALVSVTFASEHRFDHGAQRAGLDVEVTAFRWGWRFGYPGPGHVVVTSGATTPPVLRLPAGRTVRFIVTSRDVLHSLWLPELDVKRVVFPRRRDAFLVHLPQGPVAFTGRCAAFCGLGHSDMTFGVEIMPRAAFDAWLSRRRGEA